MSGLADAVAARPAAAPFRLGAILIDPPVVLAPMADITNGPFRRIVKRIAGPGLVVTELISTMAVHYNSARTMAMFDITPDQHPVAVQLFGADPAIMAEAARVAVGEGADIVDINMGCWVPKVCRTGGGAAMMNDEATAVRVVEAVTAAVGAPVTVKTRAGWHYGHLATAGLARKLEAAGAAGFALHARFAEQGHSGDADWKLIAELKAAVSGPVIGNGDVRAPDDALRMLCETGCDGVMVGRGAIGNPWLVRDVCDAVSGREPRPGPTDDERAETALEHATDLAAHLGEGRAVRHMRGQIPHYVRGTRGAAAVREGAMRAETLAELRALFAAWRQGALGEG